MLRGIHRRPAAAAAVRRLVRQPTGYLIREEPENNDYWCVFGIANYCFMRQPTVHSFAEFKGIQYTMRKMTNQAGRGNRKKYGQALRLNRHKAKKTGRWEANLRGRGLGKRRNSTYDRLLALSLLYCCWDRHGNLVAPYRVRRSEARRYEVHHMRGRYNQRLGGLAVVLKSLHKKLTDGSVARLQMPAGGQPVVAPRTF